MLKFDAYSLVVVVNSALVGAMLVIVGAWLTRGGLSATEPSGRQNVGEWALQFFVGKGREVAHGEQRDKILKLVTSLLATFFMFILVSNLVAYVPIPIINRPPTSHFSVTLALALCSVFGTLLVSGAVKGAGKTITHRVA